MVIQSRATRPPAPLTSTWHIQASTSENFLLQLECCLDSLTLANILGKAFPGPLRTRGGLLLKAPTASLLPHATLMLIHFIYSLSTHVHLPGTVLACFKETGRVERNKGENDRNQAQRGRQELMACGPLRT